MRRPVLQYLAVALTLLGLTYGLTSYPLLDPDEGRNAEIAREMAATNGFVVPRLDGLPYADKPLLFFAVEAAFMDLLGPTVLAARIPPLLFTLGTLVLVGGFAVRRSGSREAAWTAVVAAGAVPMTLGFARTVIFDSALTFFVVAAIMAFYEAVERRGAGPTTLVSTASSGWEWATVGWGALALAVLTKGPIGLALPLMVILPYAAWRRASRVIWGPAGPLLVLALILPWIMVMSRSAPDFLAYALGTETFLRLTTPALGRTGPFWYFLPILMAGAFPWSIVALTGLARGGVWRNAQRQIDPYTVLLVLWILIPLCFFSLSQSKRPQYVLPLVPPIALLVTHTWATRAPLVGARAGAAVLALVAATLCGTPWLAPRLLPLAPAIQAAIPRAAYALAASAAAGAFLAFAAPRCRACVLIAFALPIAVIPVAGGPLMRQVGRERSSAELATAIAPLVGSDGDVAAIGVFPLGLPFYLRRQVLLATSTGRELTSNYLLRDLPLWRRVPGSPLRPRTWGIERLAECGRVRVFIVGAHDAATRALIAARLPLLAETAKFAAFGPCIRSDLAVRT